MTTSFLIADTHWGHENICKFTNSDGSKVRPWNSADEMNEAMIKNWNETVPVNGKVYIVGDAVINRKHLPVFERLNGDKILIKGNHDIFKLSDYTKYFRDIRAYHVMNGVIISHIPIHTDSLARFGCNIHGHLHSSRVMKTVGVWPFKRRVIDPRYYCVSAEHTDFRPISFDEVCKRIVDQGGQVGFRNGNFSKID